MPYIDVIPPDKATGLLKKLYDAAMSRGGRIWGIISIMSPNPPAMKASLEFYGVLMHGPLPLEPRAAGDAGRGGFGLEPLRVLNTIPRPRPPCRGRHRFRS